MTGLMTSPLAAASKAASMLRDHVNCHDHTDSGCFGCHHGGKSDGADTEHSQRLAGSHVERVQHGTCAGLEAAAKRAEDGQRSVVGHLDRVMRGCA
jgi:hypothetical protein